MVEAPTPNDWKILTSQHGARITTRMRIFWIHQAYRTDPINVSAATNAILRVYDYAVPPERKLKHEPEVVFFPSPYKALTEYIAYLRSPEGRPRRGVSRVPHGDVLAFYHASGRRVDGQEELAQAVGRNLAATMLRELRISRPRDLIPGRWGITKVLLKRGVDHDVLMPQAEHCHIWFPYTDVAFASDHPEVINVDDRGRLHCEDGPALRYRDGWEIYAWHGVALPPQYILAPLQVRTILLEPNMEVRRALIEKYGLDKLVRDLKIEPVHQDKYGAVYRLANDPIPYTLVTNSTPEPNGEYKKYILKGDPRQRTAWGSVASTFGLEAGVYNPSIET